MTLPRAAGLVCACGALLVLGLGGLAIAPRWSERSPAPRPIERSIGLFDPHLHLSVRDVRVVGTSGWIVTVHARNDAARIDVDPSGLTLRAVSSDGRAFGPVERGSDEMRFAAHLAATLRPGESSDQTFLFELPADVRSPFLVIQSDDGPLPLLPASVVRLLGGRVELEL
jgi:hypothetical protein